MVELKEITKDNLEEVLKLKVTEKKRILYPLLFIHWLKHGHIERQLFPLQFMQMI